MASYFPMMAEWDKGEAAARRFDDPRPDNLIGKNTLLLCAVKKGDAALARATIAAILHMKTADHPPYRVAQSVLSGSKTWEGVIKAMMNRNEYNAQATTAIALYYMAHGQDDEAKAIIDQMLPYCAENSGKALLQSLEFGSLSRNVKPVALLSPPIVTGTMGGSTAPAGSAAAGG